MNPNGNPNQKIIAAAVVGGVVIAGVLYWYLKYQSKSGPIQPGANNNAPAAPAAGLGSEVYEKSVNPVSGKLPDAVAPIANPIEGAYKNPFE